MSPQERSHSRQCEAGDEPGGFSVQKPAWWKLKFFLIVLFLDAVTASVLLNPFIPTIRTAEDAKDHYTLYSSVSDLAILAIPRILAALVCLILSYHDTQQDLSLSSNRQHPSSLFHENGERKSRIELEEELMEEPFLPKIQRYVSRNAFICELLALLSSILLLLKCLARLNIEIGSLDEKARRHPLFWAALSLTGLWLLLEISYMDSMDVLAGDCGKWSRAHGQRRTWVGRMTRSLARPLLSSNTLQNTDDDEETGPTATTNSPRARSDIGADANYKAKWSDLVLVIGPDKHWVLFASAFLVLSAVCNVFVPKFTGEILDSLVANDNQGGGVMDIPGFVSNIEKLVAVSILGGLFEGIRGAIFTVIGSRVNVRLRLRLMDSLLAQDIGFFEMTRTGDLTSRLSSDTTLVGSQVTSNVNVFLRSIFRAAGVLLFMFTVSWQLSVLAFLTVPVVSVLSKWYGRYVRKLSKLQQRKLAEGNAVSESAISSMATVRAFGAESVELQEFQKYMAKFLSLNVKTATATMFYYTCIQALPQLMKALVLFYGGLMVQTDGPDHITGGQLVSFILYLESLGEAFNSLGGIFASLTRAVGAADKVFELMHREPRLSKPSHQNPERLERLQLKAGMLGVCASRTTEHKAHGLRPDLCQGEIVLRHVKMKYPARPSRIILDEMNITIPAGSIVALVGASGSGKSSVVSLIQHLYDPFCGEVLIDGTPVHELNPDWLHQHVSVVSQEPTLFARSVRKNIMYGLEGTDEEPSDEEIKKAAQLANAASFIERLPSGYETDIGERGVQLSGGQKQRIAIARALVRQPKVLLLDEATSALDAESEHVVQEAIDDMIRGQRSLEEDPGRSMTVVIVAHRLSTVRNADRIFVVDNGKVIEQGSHEDLMQIKSGAYRALVSRQLSPDDKLSGLRTQEFSRSPTKSDSVHHSPDGRLDLLRSQEFWKSPRKADDENGGCALPDFGV